MFAIALDPVVSENQELVRYAITQGGLLCVVFVLLWSIRKDVLAARRDDVAHLAVVSEMVRVATVAMTQSTDAAERTARAIEGCASFREGTALALARLDRASVTDGRRD